MSPEDLKELGKIYLETRHTFSTRTSKLVEYTPTPEEVAIYNRVISGETTMSQAAIELSVTAGTGVYAIIGAIGAAMHRSERA